MLLLLLLPLLLRLTNRFAHTSQEISKLAFPCFWKEAFLQSRTDLPTCIWMISKKLISENGLNEDHPKSFFLRLKKPQSWSWWKITMWRAQISIPVNKTVDWWKILSLTIRLNYFSFEVDLKYLCFEVNFVNYMFFAMYYIDTFKLLCVK